MFPPTLVLLTFSAIHIFVLPDRFTLDQLWPKILAVLTHLISQDLYELFFVFGILFSLGIQSLITRYFDDREFMQHVKVRHTFGHSLIIQLFLGFSVLFCLLTIEKKPVWIHLGANLVYLAFVAYIDRAYWKHSYSDKIENVRKLQQCCQQLYLMIDRPAFLAILALILFAWFVDPALPEAVQHLSDEDKRELRNSIIKKYMSGVIGYHLILSSWLIRHFLKEWEAANSNEGTAAP